MSLRRTAAVLSLLVLAALLVPSAASAQGFRFWGFYHLVDGEWTFAEAGPGATVPEDGEVEGWRLAVGGEDPRYPRDVLTFEEICGETEADSGTKRVGVVVDFGRAADAPEGETPPEPLARCTQVPQDATSLDVVTEAVQEVRIDPGSGVVCGLAGFPSTGCADPVDPVSDAAAATDEPIEITVASTDVVDDEDSSGPTESADDGGVPLWLWLVLGVVVIGALLMALARSTRNRDRERAEHEDHDPTHDNEDDRHI